MSLTTRPRRRPPQGAGPGSGGPGRPRPRPARGKSAAAATAHQEELAPNRRTFAGGPLAALDGDGTAFGAGTHTICMSECTSMPAALGLRRGRAGARSRGGRAARALGRAGPPGRLRRVTTSATFGQRGEGGRRGPGGAGGVRFPQRDRRSGCGRRCASPRAGPPPLGPGRRTGKAPARCRPRVQPAWAAFAELAAGGTRPG
jgi:hypothetical protein